jgi:hypothetical protein
MTPEQAKLLQDIHYMLWQGGGPDPAKPDSPRRDIRAYLYPVPEMAEGVAALRGRGVPAIDYDELARAIVRALLGAAKG